MNCKWIVEDFNDDTFTKDLVSAIKESGRCLDLTTYKPFRQGLCLQFHKDNCCVFHGSIQMAIQLREEKNPDWVLLTPENYLCSKFYPLVKDYLFNDKYEIISASQLRERKWEMYEKYGKEALIFVRPDNGIKTFTGQTIDLQDFDRVWGGTQNTQFNVKDDDLVVVSTPKNIQGEWRFICSKLREIIGCSTYIYQGQRTYIPSAPTGARELCEQILKNGYFPDLAFAIDICQGVDGMFYFMEYNAFSSCGLYSCNKKDIVDKVSELVEYKYYIGK